MLATWLSKLKISTRVIDKRSTKVFTGQVRCCKRLTRVRKADVCSQADGIQCRTVEVFQSFGFADKFLNEACHINEVVFWNPSETKEGIERTKRTPDVSLPQLHSQRLAVDLSPAQNEPGTSRFPHGVLTQGRIERFMLDAIKDFSAFPCPSTTSEC